MIKLESLIAYFETHRQLRRSQRKTLAALTWALIRNSYLGIAATGHSLAMARTTTAKHAIKRVDRFIGNIGVDMEVACRDLIDTVIGNAREILPNSIRLHAHPGGLGAGLQHRFAQTLTDLKFFEPV